MTHPSRHPTPPKQNAEQNAEQSHRSPNEDSYLPLITGGIAIVVSVCLVLLKSWAWFDSGAASVLAAVIDSAMDILISASTFAAIWYASRPADDDHRHGHGKAEGVAALFQSAFIFGSSVFVLLQAVRTMADDAPITHHTQTIQIMIAAIIINFALVAFQSYVKRKTNSLAIEADQAHYTGDIIIHLGVIIALYIDQYTNWHYIDPICAILVCAWLIYNARCIAIKALDMLLDRELKSGERQRIVEIIQGYDKIMGAHDLRTRRSGRQIQMALDIEVTPDMPLREAHDIAIELEYLILDEFPGSEIMIHIDPHGEPEDVRHTQLKDYHVIS